MNPKTGDKYIVKAKKAPFLNVGKDLREGVDAQRQLKFQSLNLCYQRDIAAKVQFVLIGKHYLKLRRIIFY